VQLAVEAARTALIQLAVSDERSPFHGRTGVRYESGNLIAGDLSVPFGTLLTTLDVPGVEATATSPSNPDKAHAFRSFGAHFCEVRVNRWTGEPRVSRMTTIIDAGQIVNLKTARNQVMGALLMGLGAALL
jgi:xanthine dehydrogenase YagR molybdenum-binding subunit